MNEHGDGERAGGLGDHESLIERWPEWQFALSDAAFDLLVIVVCYGAVYVMTAVLVALGVISRETGQVIAVAALVVALIWAAFVLGGLMSPLELLGG